jgi:hypothetical protein
MARYYARHAPVWIDADDLLQDAHEAACRHRLAYHGMIDALRRSRQMTRGHSAVPPPTGWNSNSFSPSTPEELLRVKELLTLAVTLSPDVLGGCLRDDRRTDMAQRLGRARSTLSWRIKDDWRKVQLYSQGGEH